MFLDNFVACVFLLLGQRSCQVAPAKEAEGRQPEMGSPEKVKVTRAPDNPRAGIACSLLCLLCGCRKKEEGRIDRP